jgi:hypothetical protein
VPGNNLINDKKQAHEVILEEDVEESITEAASSRNATGL